MPGSRALPFNQRKRSALSCIVAANDSTRYVAGVLRRHATDLQGAPRPITDDEVDDMLGSLRRAQDRLAQASLFVAGMKGLRRQ